MNRIIDVPRGRARTALQRRHIWQIQTGMHCSVLGTCLSLSDLYAIARRAHCHIDSKASAYQIHSWFVDYMASQNDLSKLTDKTLEKRHGRIAQAVRRARTAEELEARWKEHADRGQIAAAYWGAMSHPLCSPDLQWKMFGDIHMLSHLVGSSRTADLCRLERLEMSHTTLESELAELKHDHRALLKERKKLEDESVLQRREVEHTQRRLTSAKTELATLKAEPLTIVLTERVTVLETELLDARTRASTAEASVTEIRSRLADAESSRTLAAEQVQELTAENEALELELQCLVVCPSGERQEELGLCGKKVLYVGGRGNLVQHYRALVERRGGEFLHHDGGIEESLDAVTRSMATVDAVVLPVDCVSHAAWIKVKRACKQFAKQLVVLRSSGLSSFARGIQTIARADLDAGCLPALGE
ncbi:MAG TPA: DUF2325 domain-containing protein [Polyangiaceae bacterium]